MLEQELGQLAIAIRAAFTAYAERNSIATLRQVRVRRRDFSLKYRPDIGFPGFAPERIEENIWDWRDQERFHDTVVTELPEYKSLIATVAPKATLVQDFARSVAIAAFHRLPDEKVQERVNALGSELAERALPVKITAFIDGLAIAESPLFVSDGLVLHKPEPEDVAEYIPLDEYGGFSIPRGDTWFHTIGEFVFEAISAGAAQQVFARTIQALRLFRVGGVAANRYKISSGHSFLQGGGATLYVPASPSQYAYTLSRSDAATLKEFLRNIGPLVQDPFRQGAVATEKEIAYARYSDAMLQGGPSERTITSAITALEALFLKGEPELTYRLAQRASLFLRILGTQVDAQDTHDKVKRGYGIRSTFIHGSSLTAKDRPRADSLAPVLLEYARQCTLAFLQVTTPKAELLKQLDRAMIDLAGVSDLEVSLKPIIYR